MDAKRSQFVKYLERHLRRYREILEDRFGPCDPKFVFGSFRKSVNNMPRTHFPYGYHTNGNCIVDIHLSDFSWEHCSLDQGPWQVAHECVHLLDPGTGGTTVLEEGLATWFQDESEFHDAAVRRYIIRNEPHPNNYESAKQLVLDCMPQLTRAVKEIRASGKRIREISADMLAARLPHADRGTVDKLCAKFPI